MARAPAGRDRARSLKYAIYQSNGAGFPFRMNEFRPIGRIMGLAGGLAPFRDWRDARG